MTHRKILLVEVLRPGHAYSHARAWVSVLRGQGAEVIEHYLESAPPSLCALVQEAHTRGCTELFLTTLDTFYLHALKGGGVPLRRRIVIGGVLHDVRPLSRFTRRLVWQVFAWLNQIDRVWLYSLPVRAGRASKALPELFQLCDHPVQEATFVRYQGQSNLLFFGVLNEEKGAGRLGRLAASLPDGFTLWVLGTCPDKRLRKRLALEWAKLIAMGRIRWEVKEVSENEKKTALSCSFCLVAPYLPSHGRASGIAVDAVSYRIPILYERGHEWMQKFLRENHDGLTVELTEYENAASVGCLDQLLQRMVHMRAR